MTIAFSCEKCGKKIKTADKALGKRVKCPYCGAICSVSPADAQPGSSTRTVPYRKSDKTLRLTRDVLGIPGRSKDWPRLRLKGIVHMIPMRCPSCGSPGDTEMKVGHEDKIAIFYCSPCAGTVKEHQSLNVKTMLAVMLIASIGAVVGCTLSALVCYVAAPDFLNRICNNDSAYLGLILVGGAIPTVALLLFLVLPPLFRELSQGALSAAPFREQQLEWGQAVYIKIGFSSTVFSAADENWLALLKEMNLDHVLE